MSLHKTKYILLSLIILSTFSACSFNPMYGDNSNSKYVMDNIYIDKPVDRKHQIVRNEYFFADRTEETKVLSSVLLNNVDSVELSFTNQGQSYLSWPSQITEEIKSLPQMVEVTLKIKSYGDVSMSYLLTEGFQV